MDDRVDLDETFTPAAKKCIHGAEEGGVCLECNGAQRALVCVYCGFASTRHDKMEDHLRSVHEIKKLTSKPNHFPRFY